MARFFSNHDGQVQIPRRVVMDTSCDEEVARGVQEGLGVVMEMEGGERVAREVQEELGVVMDTQEDEEMARRLQDRTLLPDTGRDEGMARRMQEREARRRENAVLKDEAIARRMQQQMDREDQARRYGARRNTGNVEQMADRFGGMSFEGRGQRGRAFGSESGYERRRPQNYDQRQPQRQPQGQEGRNGYDMVPRYGGNAGYGHPGPGQYYYDEEGDEDFEQPFGGGR
jgi:hypothetical protein